MLVEQLQYTNDSLYCCTLSRFKIFHLYITKNFPMIIRTFFVIKNTGLYLAWKKWSLLVSRKNHVIPV